MELKTIENNIEVHENDKEIEIEDKNEYEQMDLSTEEPVLLYQKKTNESEMKQTQNIIKKNLILFIKKLQTFKPVNRKLMITCFFISIFCFLSKIYLLLNMSIFVLPKIGYLRIIISNYLNQNMLSIPLYHIDLIFFFLGLIIFAFFTFVEFALRFKFFLNPLNSKVFLLVGNKILFFISLGFIPEVSIVMFEFKNKNNIIRSFFIIKIISQPFILLILLIYSCTLIKIYRGEDKREKIKKHFSIYKNIILDIVNSRALRWNNFEAEDMNEPIARDSIKSTGSEENNNNTVAITCLNIQIKYILLLILLAVLLSPVINGIFQYGYFFFLYKKKLSCLLFKLDFILSIIIGMLLIKIVD